MTLKYTELGALQYRADLTPEQIFEEHRAWGEDFIIDYSQFKKYRNTLEEGRQLQVGIISYFLWQPHVLQCFMQCIFKYNNKESCKYIIYNDAPTMMSHKDARNVYFLKDEALAQAIRKDRIDILIDIDGQFGCVRYGVFAMKPAPIQVNYLGHPDTTGLPTIDYRITDAIADPIDNPTKSVEKLWRLPQCFMAYAPYFAESVGIQPMVKPTCPMESNGFITFGVFNNTYKFLDDARCLDLWARILMTIPDSKIKFRYHSTAEERWHALKERLIARGVTDERISILPCTGGITPEAMTEHYTMFDEVDVLLDPITFSGATTTCEALYMGIPVVTLRGNRHANRVSASVLTYVGLPSFVANTEDEYVSNCKSLLNEAPFLSYLRSHLRQTMKESPLGNGPAFALTFETALREMWHIFCKETK